MARPNPATNNANPTQGEDTRAEWDRPALVRLKISGAEAHQKKSEDGSQGKGGS